MKQTAKSSACGEQGDASAVARFGFSSGRNSAHTARTLMLSELTRLLDHLDRDDARTEDYVHAIVDDNCLAKRSGSTRRRDLEYLLLMYSLDPSRTLFRTLRYFWERDTQGQPLLALLCACARDSLLRATASFVLPFPEGETVTRVSMEAFVDSLEPKRFSQGTLKSTSQNLNSTWTQSGHLTGRAVKHRTIAQPTSGAVAYALLLGYLQGMRGELMFQSEHMRLLDCSKERAVNLAETATQRGWLVFKHIGDVKDVSFPGLLTPQEMEWSRE